MSVDVLGEGFEIRCLIGPADLNSMHDRRIFLRKQSAIYQRGIVSALLCVLVMGRERERSRGRSKTRKSRRLATVPEGAQAQLLSPLPLLVPSRRHASSSPFPSTSCALLALLPFISIFTAHNLATLGMSLDQNLFTLNVTPRADDRNIIDLVDPRGVAHYMKRRLPTNEYNIEVYGTHIGPSARGMT